MYFKYTNKIILFQDLENCLRNHPQSRVERLNEIGAILTDHNVMVSNIKVDLAKITSRCKKLTTQVIICFVIYDYDSICIVYQNIYLIITYML